MEPQKPLPHEPSDRLPDEPEPVNLPLLPGLQLPDGQPYFDAAKKQWFVDRFGERQVFFNDGDICVCVVQQKDRSVEFRAVVRLDTTDIENPDTPLTREEFLAKYPLRQSVVDFPNANPKTRALCQRYAENYHAHETEYMTLSAVKKAMILDPPKEGEVARVKIEDLPDRQQIGIGVFKKRTLQVDESY